MGIVVVALLGLPVYVVGGLVFVVAAVCRSAAVRLVKTDRVCRHIPCQLERGGP